MKDASAFIAVLSSALILSLVLTPTVARLGRRLRLVDLPSDRRRHATPTPRTGGVALFLSFFVVALLVYLIEFVFQSPAVPDDALRLRGVLLGTAFVFIFGLVDDHYELKPGPQFGVQFVAALIAIAHTVFIQEVTNPLKGEPQTLSDAVTFVFTVFWVMGMMNTVNWLDGLDGLAAGVGAIAALLFAIHSYNLAHAHEPMRMNVALFPMALVGACLGVLPYNFYPARVFLGSAGALTLGYALATLSILAPARIATALLVMAIPIIDVAWLIFSRWRRGVRPSTAGRDHLHFRLLDRGWSQRRIVIIYYGFSTFLGSLALLMPSGLPKLLALIATGVVMVVILMSLSRTTKVDQSISKESLMTQELIHTIFARRSIRSYTKEIVTEGHIKTLLEAAMSAPSASNLKPWHFIVVTSRQALDNLADVHPHGKMLFEAPLCIAVCGDPAVSIDYWVQDCCAATENLLLAAAALGLGAVWLGVHPKGERVTDIRRILGIPKSIVPLNLISIGHPAEEKEPRTQYEETRVHREKW